MSEYWHNGSIILDRTLSEKEKQEALDFFAVPYMRSKSYWANDVSLRDIHPLEYRNIPAYDPEWPTSTSDPVPKVTVLDFDDYLTGRDFDETLERFVSWCKNRGVGIDGDSLLSYYGDDDGAYDFPDGELRCLDRDEYGALNCDTGFLISELFSRKSGIKSALEVLPTEALFNELNRRGIYDYPPL